MKRRTLLILQSAILLCLTLFPETARLQSNAIAIVGATVIDGTGADPKSATVIIRGERIEAVLSADAKPPAGARVINGEGQTLMPGIFDLHTHLPYASGGGVSGDWGKHLKAYL